MNNLKKIRTDAGLTQREAASKCGWQQSRWSGYETGNRLPSPEDIKMIISALSASGVQTTFENIFGDAA